MPYIGSAAVQRHQRNGDLPIHLCLADLWKPQQLLFKKI
jgi:hypothetical protein